MAGLGCRDLKKTAFGADGSRHERPTRIGDLPHERVLVRHLRRRPLDRYDRRLTRRHDCRACEVRYERAPAVIEYVNAHVDRDGEGTWVGDVDSEGLSVVEACVIEELEAVVL